MDRLVTIRVLHGFLSKLNVLHQLYSQCSSSSVKSRRHECAAFEFAADHGVPNDW